MSSSEVSYLTEQLYFPLLHYVPLRRINCPFATRLIYSRNNIYIYFFFLGNTTVRSLSLKNLNYHIDSIEFKMSTMFIQAVKL